MSNFYPEWSYTSEVRLENTFRYPLSRIYEYAAFNQRNQIAVNDGTSSYTFAELEKGAQAIAGKFFAIGVRPKDHVVILAKKISLMAILAAAIWKIGAVYVPIDPQQPANRLISILKDVKPSVIIGDKEDLRKIVGVARSINFEDLETLARNSQLVTGEISPYEVKETDVAYIMFTSGSTGTPKGVMISHGSLLDYFSNHNAVLRYTNQSRVFSLAPFHFDVSIEDTILPLSLGAYVYLFKGIPVGPLIRNLLIRERITHLIAVSTLLSLITENGKEIDAQKFGCLEMLMTGAEVCDPKIINTWKENLPNVRVINAYGPTEATIVCCTHTIDNTERNRSKAYPIGLPLKGVKAKLMKRESSSEILEPYVEGELWIGGSQVMLGYLNKIEETKKVLAQLEGITFYRTGDLCQYNEVGELEYIGRMDEEIKIAGRRIHLGEIRQLVLSYPKIVRAIVGAIEISGKKNIALIIISDICEDIADGLKEFLNNNLPSYMLPKIYAVATTLQLTSTGKTNEKEIVRLLSNACTKTQGTHYFLNSNGEFVSQSEKNSCLL